MNSRPLNFIGIGAMRCATTWLSRCIEYHPELFIPTGIKEIHYFDKFIKEKPHGAKKRWNYEKGNKWYENHFSQAKEHQLIGEYTPNYFSDEKAASLIHENYPDAKLILSLRNPVERLISHWRYVSRNHAGIPDDLAAALASHNEEHYFLELGLYGKYLQEYLRYFPMEQILILFYDDIQLNPDDSCKALYSFLGVDDSFIPPILSQNINSSQDVKIKSLLKSMRWIKQNIKKTGLLRRMIESLGGVRVGRWINKQNRAISTESKQNISPDTLSYLRQFYHDDLELLEGLTGKNLAEWK